MLCAIVAILLVRVDYNLGIAIGPQAMSTLSKLFLQFTIIVDFSIEDDQHTFILVEHGLVTTGSIYNGEAAHAECYAVSYPHTMFVRATVSNDLAHCIDQPTCLVIVVTRVNESSYSAHVLASSRYDRSCPGVSLSS
jgi:hypothetical protein